MNWLQQSLVEAGAVLVVAIPTLVAFVRWAAEKAVDKKFREWELRFSTFHGRLVDAIETIRRALAEASEALDDYRRGADFLVGPDLGDEFVKVQRALRTAKLEFEARSFYFDQPSRQMIQRVYDSLTKTFVGVRLRLLAEDRGRPLPEERARILEKVSATLEEAMETLDERFRALVGGSTP